MVDPCDEKPKKVPKEEVYSKQENVDTTPPNPTRQPMEAETLGPGLIVAVLVRVQPPVAKSARNFNNGPPGRDYKNIVLEKHKRRPDDLGASSSSSTAGGTPNPTRTADDSKNAAPRADRDGVGASAAGVKAVTGDKSGRNVNTGPPGRDHKIEEEKVQLLDRPSSPPRRYICGKILQSWKVVFCHVRKHKVGEERVHGAFLPPVFTPPCRASPGRGYGYDAAGSAHDKANQEDLQDQLPSMLLDLACRNNEEVVRYVLNKGNG
ncbi:hypothetical protein ACOSQ2_021449 [Xanthoceras sorbifolium]